MQAAMAADFRLLTDVARAGAARHPDRPALESAASPQPALTYGELWQRVEHGAAGLRSAGLVRGERVLLALEGRPEWAGAFFAILRAGLVVVPIPPETDARAAAAIAASARARACVLGARAGALGEALAGVKRVSIEELFAARPDDEGIGDKGTASELALLAFTSGSTSTPRAVELTHANLLANLGALLSVRGALPGDALLSMLPPAHLFELVGGLLAPLACGLRIVYSGPPLPNRLITALREHRITHALTVPALLSALYEEILAELVQAGTIEPGREQQSLRETAERLRSAPDALERARAPLRARIGPDLRVLCVGGAAVDPLWAQVLTPLGITLELGYGLTEASPIVSVGNAGECPPGSVGRALPGVEVRVDEQGEILVRGASVMRGYHDDPEGTARALDGGWLRTGDHGRLDQGGFLFVTGRLKEVLKTAAGETIYPEEIEPFYASPLFAEHCVVPVRQADGNDLPTLVIVPAAPDVSDGEIARAHASLRAAAPARLRAAGPVRLAHPLPRTALGKIRRRAVADAIATNRATNEPERRSR
jgi:long-chain acyl-CoA synthetase